jgi:hypothetical protein
MIDSGVWDSGYCSAVVLPRPSKIASCPPPAITRRSSSSYSNRARPGPLDVELTGRHRAVALIWVKVLCAAYRSR